MHHVFISTWLIIKQVLLHDFNACIYKSYNLKLIKWMVAISFLIVKSYILKRHKYYSTVLLRNFHPKPLPCFLNILKEYTVYLIYYIPMWKNKFLKHSIGVIAVNFKHQPPQPDVLEDIPFCNRNQTHRQTLNFFLFSPLFCNNTE